VNFRKGFNKAFFVNVIRVSQGAIDVENGQFHVSSIQMCSVDRKSLDNQRRYRKRPAEMRGYAAGRGYE